MANGAAELVHVSLAAPDPLEELERDCLETAREAIRSPRLYPSLAGTTRQIANDYRNRALFELVQNAHDALGGEGQDEIRIVYRRTGEGAVLMVANRGVGFDDGNVEGVRLPSRSTKKYGEGIGNKGLGLRSLASLTHVPEIYSCLGEGRPRERFDGYCFRFADDAAARAVFEAAGAPAGRIEWLLKHVPRSLLTVPIRTHPDEVKALARAGFATVVRVVLTSPSTMADVEAQISQFTEGEAPPTLFLSRIGTLGVEVQGARVRSARIVRKSTGLEEVTGPVPLSVSRARVDGADFLVVRRPLPRDGFEEAVRKSVEHDPKLEEWLDAPEETVVSLAVPLGKAEGKVGRTYCYLPLGEGVGSPFLGHLDAPFHASLNRKEMDPKAPLNAFLLEACAGAALAAARHLAAGAAERLEIDRRAVADLVSWRAGHARHLMLANGGRPPADDALLPVAGGGWTSFRAARRWEASKDGLTARALAMDASAPILDSRLGKARLDRIGEARGSMWLSADMAPSSAEVARWVEALATVRSAQRDPWKTWGRFLDAVVISFVDQGLDLAELSGKEILFGGPSEAKPSTLAAQSSVDDPVYLAASAGRGRKREAKMPPRSLGRRVNLVDSRIGLASATREALLGAKLVSDVDPLRILRDHRRIVSANAKPETLAGILSWAFDVWDALKDDATKVLREARLRVPTRAGHWIEASEALLSGRWSDEGNRLETVVRELVEKSPDAKAVDEALVADPGTGPFPSDEQARTEWTKFLVACGVKDGMRPIPSPAKLAGQAHKFWRWYLDGKWNSAPTDQHWLAAVAGTTFAFSQSAYVGKDPAGLGFCRLPCQAEHDSLSPEGKIEYALLVLGMLREMGKGFLTVKVVHESKGDPKELPSPARAFLSRAAWMPVAEGNGIAFAAASDVWWRRTRGREIPRAIRRPHEEVRSRLVEEKVWSRVAELGICDWSMPGTAVPRLASLAEAAQTGIGTADEKAAFRAATALAWHDLVLSGAKLPQGASFPVGVGEGFEVLHAGKAFDGRVYVASDVSTMEARILQERGAYMIEGASSPKEIAAALAEAGVPAVPLADLNVGMLADGVRFIPSGSSPRLVGSGREWLVDLAVLALDVEGRMLAYQVSRPAFRSALDKVRLHFCSKLAAVVDDGPPSELIERFVHLDDKENPTLLVVGSHELGWEDMKPLARALERLVDRRADGALRLAFAAVGTAFTGAPFERPPNAAVAGVLRCAPWRVDQAFGRDTGGLEHVRKVVAPVVASLFGHGIGLAMLSDLEQADGEFDLSGWLRRAKVETPLPVEEFADACCEAEDRDSLRRRFGLTLVDYNVAVAALGQEPLESRADLRGQFEFHRRATRARVIERLRRHHYGDFAAGGSLSAYAEMRKMPFLAFEESWPRSIETVDSGLVEKMADLALDARYGAVVPEVDLEPFGTVHAKNEAAAAAAVRKSTPVVVAWCRAKGIPVPEIWKQAPVEVVRQLDAAGTLDFVVLNDDTVHLPYALAGIWPAGMPASSDPKALGLGASQVEDARNWRSEENRKREVERRRFTFAGNDYDGGSKSDLAAMVAAARSQTEADAGWEGRCRRANLMPIDETDKRAGGGGGGSGRGKPGLVVSERRMSEAKRNAVGLLGEVRAFDWIMRKHGLTREETEEAWCSPNRTVTSLGKTGDDADGYDFEVIKENGTRWRYEVKASQYDPGEFELGSSEVKAALEAASDRNVKYRILYVPEVATAGRWRVIELPNPLAPSKRGFFEELGRSALGFGFTEKI